MLNASIHVTKIISSAQCKLGKLTCFLGNAAQSVQGKEDCLFFLMTLMFASYLERKLLASAAAPERRNAKKTQR